APHGRSRLPEGRRAVRLRPREGRDHRQRAQVPPAGSRVGARGARRPAARQDRRLRRRAARSRRSRRRARRSEAERLDAGADGGDSQPRRRLVRHLRRRRGVRAVGDDHADDERESAAPRGARAISRDRERRGQSTELMDLLDKLRTIAKRRDTFGEGAIIPGETVIDRMIGPCEVVINGQRTLMFGSNNYLGLTLHPEIVAAAQRAIVEYGTGTTGSRTANGTLSLHEQLEREFADWFGKRRAL